MCYIELQIYKLDWNIKTATVIGEDELSSSAVVLSRNSVSTRREVPTCVGSDVL